MIFLILIPIIPTIIFLWKLAAIADHNYSRIQCAQKARKREHQIKFEAIIYKLKSENIPLELREEALRKLYQIYV